MFINHWSRCVSGEHTDKKQGSTLTPPPGSMLLMVPRDLSAQQGRQRCCQQISFSQSASQRPSFPLLFFRLPYSHLIPLLVYQGRQRKVAQTGYWFSNSSGVQKSEVKVSPGLGPPSLSCSWSYSPQLHVVFLWSVCLYPFLLFIKGYMPLWIRSQPNDLMLI